MQTLQFLGCGREGGREGGRRQPVPDVSNWRVVALAKREADRMPWEGALGS